MMTHTDHPAECTMCARFFATWSELKNHETVMHCQSEQVSEDIEAANIPTVVDDVSTNFTSCLDLTKKNKAVKKLGFSIEDIMKR